MLSESQSEVSTLETEIRRLTEQKQELERKHRLGEEEKAAFDKVITLKKKINIMYKIDADTRRNCFGSC